MPELLFSLYRTEDGFHQYRDEGLGFGEKGLGPELLFSLYRTEDELRQFLV
jgi:hypothetical protein